MYASLWCHNPLFNKVGGIGGKLHYGGMPFEIACAGIFTPDKPNSQYLLWDDIKFVTYVLADFCQQVVIAC